MDSSLLEAQGFLGLRCVRIHRYQHGFGFTLRHFIVYPPELYSEDGDPEGHGYENGIGQTRLHKVTEPVDTIFVKSVKENSPAQLAGLCVGDRIVSVNGETIVGKSYDQVVSLIQKTRDLLCLEVSPKQYDTLQLFYEEQAYRPETNQRPYETLTNNLPPEPLYHHPVHHNLPQQHLQRNINFHPNDYVYPNRSYDSADFARLNNNMSSSHSNQPSAQFLSHLPRPVPYKSSSDWASTSARNGDRSSSLSQSNKSTSQRAQPQLYYPFNHSFEKSTTLWKVRERDEPNSGAKSADSILGESGDDTAVYRSPLRSESMECLSEINTNSDKSWKKAGPGYRYSISTAKALGSGTSQPSDFRNTMVVTMSSTNSGQAFRHPRDPIYSDGAPLGLDTYTDRIRKSCEQKEEFLRRPNQPLWSSFANQPPPLPYPKELYAQPQKFTKVPWPPDNILPSFSSTQQPIQSSVTDSRHATNRTDRRAKPNNVTVISVQHSGPDSLSSGSSCRPETSNSDSWSPVESDNKIEKHKSEPYSSSDLLSMYELPKNRTMVIGSTKLHCDPPPGWHFYPKDTVTESDVSSQTGKLKQNQPPSITSRSIESSDVLDPPGSFETEIDVLPNTENVILRKKELEPESESERLVRRVSYLKATSSPIDMERKSTSPTSPVKSFEVMSCKPTFPSGGTGRRRSMANKLSAEFFPKGRIYKLKQFFEDRTQPTASLFKFYVDSPTDDVGLGKAEKLIDSSEFIRDGKIHFKIRIGENKRGNYNRSWRQGFAQVRRSGYLYLSKERQPKDTVTGNEESVIISVSIRDGVHIEYAEDYTKRKNVLRVRTSFHPDDESNFPLPLTSDSYQNSNFNPTVSCLTVEILLQCEDHIDLTTWFKCLQRLLENNNCKNDSPTTTSNKGIVFGAEFCPKSKSFFTSLLPSPGGTPGQTSNDKGGNTSLTVPSSSNALTPNLGTGASNTAASPKVKTWKGKVAKQWKKVHDIIDTNTNSDNKSPYATLPPAGDTFGINLENCPPGESNPFIPRVIEYSIDLVERKGIEMVGLYRIPGNNASVALLTERLNRGEDPNPEKDPRWLDVHVVASLIKSFLRRLPDPLLTNDRYPAFIHAADEEESVCFAKTKELIHSLPKHNYETLKAVVMHLKHVAEKGDVNKMDARNLAIVFGPTIVRTAGENFSSMVADMKNQCKIVESLILRGDSLFDISESKPVSVVLRHATEDNIEPDDVLQPVDSQQTLSPTTPPESAKNELKASLFKAAKRKVSAKENQPLELEVPLQHEVQESYKPVDEKGFIRSYAGLNEVTERRIRNFELETRAMLSRDDRSPNSSVINVGTSKPPKTIDDIKQQQMKLDDELKKAKDDLETEDIYDKITDKVLNTLEVLVHHRERTLGMCASNPGPFNLSNSSLSSSNSNSTAPSLLTSSLPAWPTGSRVGPQPFRNSMPPQSLPPKPPAVPTNSSSLNSSFEIVQSNAQGQSSIRRVNSIDRLQGSRSPSDRTMNEMSAKFDKLTNKESFKALRRPDGRLASSNPKQLGGSLDSLNDINSRIQCSKPDDLSPRSSDGSDMVTTLTKTLDKKLENLRTQFSGTRLVDDSREVSIDILGDYKTGNSQEKTIKDNELVNENYEVSNSQNHFLKKGRRRHSLIERRKSSVDVPSNDAGDALQQDSPLNSNHKTNENHSENANTANSTSSQKAIKDCRRRHSLSGATDILSLVFRGSEKLSVHRDRDSEQKNNKTLSSEALLSALKNASILESHV